MEEACSITRTGLQHRPVSENSQTSSQTSSQVSGSFCPPALNPQQSNQSRAAALAQTETHPDLFGATGGTAAPTAPSGGFHNSPRTRVRLSDFFCFEAMLKFLF